MSTPMITDVFKFLAVRPAQLVTEKETARTIIRDKRAATRAGNLELSILARKLSQPDAALAHWQDLDLSLIEPLAEGYRDLTRSYERVGPDEELPEARTLMAEAGLASVGDGSDPKLTSTAWEALYTAHATGHEAGLRLEMPMAALRLLHFVQTLIDDPEPLPSTALEALRATVAIPAAFDDAFQPTSFRPATPAPNVITDTPISPNAARRSAQIRSLVTDLHATNRLLESVTNAGALENSAARQVSLEPTPGWSARLNLTTIPSLSEVLPTRLSRDEAAVLDHLRIAETAAVPFAAQTLQSHLQMLTDQAFALVDDQEFQTALMEAAEALPMKLAPILPIVIAPLAAQDLAKDANAKDVDVSGRITPLGIGDLKVVKQTLLAYVAGEVAHIENVLKGESKERTHRKLDRTETILFTSEEETKDTERDTQSTDRFELKREAEQTLKEDMSIKAGLTVTASYGPVVATATGDFAYSTSKQESQKNSSNFAREVVDRSVTKVQTKTKTERTTKTLNEVEEINRHILDNGQPSSGHITGIYRWVDKRYRAQVYNYGVRLLLEFIIPEPAAFYRTTHAGAAPKVNGLPPRPFLKDPNIMAAPGAVSLGRIGSPIPLTAEDINEFNYLRYAARYGTTGVTPPPPLFAYIGLALAATEGVDAGKSFSIASKDFVVPGGYKLSSYSIAVSYLQVNWPQFNIQVRGDIWQIVSANSRGGAPMFIHERQIGDVAFNNAQVSGSVPVSAVGYDIVKFALDVQGVCLRTDEAMVKWRLETFEKIQTAYQVLQTAYDQKVTEAASAAGAGIMLEGQNPITNRVVEKNELKKLCITMMTGQHFNKFGQKPGAMTEPSDDVAHPPEVDVYEALYEGPIIQFFEQAFEWEQMTYLYYPYFWGRKKNWAKVTNQSDPDPLFQQFLTAGAARVLVPVPLAYVDSVRYLLQNPLGETELRKKVWKGGESPTLDSDLYRSIAEELRNQTDDLAGATPEGPSWEFTLPTTLVWLQPDDKLPSFE